jgi:hypothetical protein
VVIALRVATYKSIHETISNNLYLNRLPLKSRMLGNSNSSTASRDSDLSKLMTLILGWIRVVIKMKCIPQNSRKPFPIQAISVSISISIPIDPLNICHMNQKDSNVRLVEIFLKFEEGCGKM